MQCALRATQRSISLQVEEEKEEEKEKETDVILRNANRDHVGYHATRFPRTEQKSTYRNGAVLNTLILLSVCCMSAQSIAVALQLVKQLTPFACRSTPAAPGSDPTVIASSLCRAAQLLIDRASEPPGWSRGCVLHNMCLDRITTSSAPEAGIERCGFAGFTVRSEDRHTSRTPQPFLHGTLHLSGLLCISRLCLLAQLQRLRLL